MYDVVVIGAGPAGNVCAALTAKAGLSTLVLEEHEAAGLFVNCTGIIGTEAFQQLDLPKEPVIGRLETIAFYAPSGRSFRYDPGHPLAYIVARQSFDQALADRAYSNGAQFRFGYHARSISLDSEAVEIRQQEDDPDPVLGRVVVIATGFGSNLPAQVGLQGPKEIVYGVQAEVEMEGLKDVEIYLGQEVAPQAFAWVVPLFHSNGRLPSLARVGLITSKQAPRYFRSLLAHPAIRQRLRTPHPMMLVSPVPLVPMDCSVTDRVLVVGEAAGQVKTTTQGGIYYGMLCASLAAQTIVEAFQSGDFSATFLKRYHRAWTQAIGPELKTGLTLRRLFARFSDQQIEALIELGMREDVLGLVKRLAQFDWHRDLIRTSLQWPAMQQVIRGGLW